MKKVNEKFCEYISFMDFSIGKDQEGFFLEDLQGANLGDIDQDRFTNAVGIIDRLDVYIDDYVYQDLIEDAESAGIVFEKGVNPMNFSFAEWIQFCKENSIQSYHLKILEFMEAHLEDVDLDECVRIFEKEKEERNDKN